MSDRHELQATGTHPAPCARHCESTAYEIEIRRLRTELVAGREREARMRGALRNLLALDADHQRGADDEDVCAEVREARAALAEVAAIKTEVSKGDSK